MPKNESAVAAENRVLRDQVKNLKKPKGIPNAQKREKEVVVIPDEVLLEREIRKFVKRAGGFRKGLTGDQLDRAKKLLAKAGRPYKKEEVPRWDKAIQVPGIAT